MPLAPLRVDRISPHRRVCTLFSNQFLPHGANSKHAVRWFTGWRRSMQSKQKTKACQCRCIVTTSPLTTIRPQPLQDLEVASLSHCAACRRVPLTSHSPSPTSRPRGGHCTACQLVPLTALLPHMLEQPPAHQHHPAPPILLKVAEAPAREPPRVGSPPLNHSLTHPKHQLTPCAY